MFLEKLSPIESKIKILEAKLQDINLVKNQKEYAKAVKEYNYLEKIKEKKDEYENILSQINENLKILSEEENLEMKELVKQELTHLNLKKDEVEHMIKILLLHQDENDSKNIIIEIRAGTGGEEAALFAHNLYEMYTKYSEKKKWKTELINFNETELGGFKEVSFEIKGKDVFKKLKHESGVHRVQRVPITESNGRLQTSAATVAVLPEIEDTDIEINEKDLRIDVYRSSGAGGQHVNTTDSAVRITHLPTGIVAQCQNERSQHKNKDQAMKILRARLYEFEDLKKQEQRSNDRKQQVGSGDRSERIRTYNFPQNRVTDHRANISLYKLEEIMQGELDSLLDTLALKFQEQALKDNPI
ncbi:Bacterial Peptide Chain Release Factor 1 (RF-1) [Borrelia nietonii YOR]|uniref:Peptide chain release factor 1 n=1 Tax=Borrelia nietonii YOR TaxID=1293576 RepID=A0ABN4C243_9SPIR|nr:MULTISPECIES: peptide chain release factor 1 [Borrelia]AHH03159.1 Bacterial Peptide Chain Release Factor 1 (RF-1) [Borrelia nietonii YOR]AHH13693.1 Bacterial Peptide Chain Release Factor 1 (RF-1) [Borrelia hermsii MTW]UPA08921.1 peptide chain release factor 1 [Borrelia nietonii YOR]